MKGHNNDDSLRDLQQDLAYNEMTMGNNGSVVSRAEKVQLRLKHGFCIECEGIPVRLYVMKKSKLNPLWVSKDARAVSGECANGICFACRPEQDPTYRPGRRHTPNNMDHLPGGRSPVPDSSHSRSSAHSNSSRRGVRSPIRNSSRSSAHSSSSGRVSRTPTLESSNVAARASALPTPPFLAEEKPSSGSGVRKRTPFNSGVYVPSAPPAEAQSVDDETIQIQLTTLEESTETKSHHSNRSNDEKKSATQEPTAHQTNLPAEPIVHDFSNAPTPVSPLPDQEDSSHFHARSSSSKSLTDAEPSSSARQRRPLLNNTEVASFEASDDHRVPSISRNIEDSSQRSSRSRRSYEDDYGDASQGSASRRTYSTKDESVVDGFIDGKPFSKNPSEIESSDMQTASTASMASGPSSRSILAQQSISTISTGASLRTVTLPLVSPPPAALPSTEDQTTVEGIDALIADMAGDSDVLPDILLGSVREHADRPTVLAHCLGKLYTLGLNDENFKYSLMRTGAPEEVIGAMKRFGADLTLQKNACDILWALGANEHNRVALIRARACHPLVQALTEHIETLALAESAIRAMRILSPEIEAREAFSKIKASRVTSEAMITHKTSVAIQRDGCAFLSNCAVNIEKQQVTVVPFEELLAIVEGMAAHPYENIVMEGACFALKNYSFEEQNCRTLRRCPNIDSLILHASQYHQAPSCIDDAAEISERMQFSKTLDESLEEQECMMMTQSMGSQIQSGTALSGALERLENYNWSARVIALCLDVIARVVQKDGIGQVISGSTQRSIYRAVQIFPTDPTVLEGTCGILTAMAEDASSHDQLLDPVDWCGFLLEALESNLHDRDLATHILQLLQTLSSSSSSTSQAPWHQRVRTKLNLLTEALAVHESSEAIQDLGPWIFSMLD